MALTNGTNTAMNGDASAHLNGSGTAKIKNKAALKRAKQKKAKLTAASRESSVVGILRQYDINAQTLKQDVYGHLFQAPSSEATPIEIDEETDQDVEYVSEPLDVPASGIEEFSNVFARFQLPSEESTVRLSRHLHPGSDYSSPMSHHLLRLHLVNHPKAK